MVVDDGSSGDLLELLRGGDVVEVRVGDDDLTDGELVAGQLGENFWDVVARVKALTNGRGLPVVYDSVGKTTFEQSLQCLRPRGLVVLFGGASGAVPPFDLIRLSTMGSLYVTRPTLKDYIATRNDLEARAKDVFDGVVDGTLRLRLEHIYPLADAAHAHRDLESRKTTGKLLLIP